MNGMDFLNNINRDTTKFQSGSSFLEEELGRFADDDEKEVVEVKEVIKEATVEAKTPKKEYNKRVEYFYILQEDLLSATFDDFGLDTITDNSEEMFCNVANDKKKGVDSSCGMNYCKLPVELLVRNKMEDKEEYICLYLATWIFTYSRKNHSYSLKKACQQFNLSVEDITNAIEKYGEEFCLSYIEFKDKFKRKKKNIQMDFDSYYNYIKGEDR